RPADPEPPACSRDAEDLPFVHTGGREEDHGAIPPALVHDDVVDLDRGVGEGAEEIPERAFELRLAVEDAEDGTDDFAIVAVARGQGGGIGALDRSRVALAKRMDLCGCHCGTSLPGRAPVRGCRVCRRYINCSVCVRSPSPCCSISTGLVTIMRPPSASSIRKPR